MMSEDDPRLKPRPGSDTYAETLLYDYAKFPTTLALLALGGVLLLSQSDGLAGIGIGLGAFLHIFWEALT